MFVEEFHFGAFLGVVLLVWLVVRLFPWIVALVGLAVIAFEDWRDGTNHLWDGYDKKP